MSYKPESICTKRTLSLGSTKKEAAASGRAQRGACWKSEPLNMASKDEKALLFGERWGETLREERLELCEETGSHGRNAARLSGVWVVSQR